MSNFRPDTRGAKVVTYLGSLVQSCCREGGSLQASTTGMCGERLQCLGRPGFAPAQAVCAFQVCTAQAPGCSAGNCLKQALGCVHLPGLRRSGSGSRVLHWGTDSVGPVVCALPRSEQLRRPGAWPAQSPQVRCVLSPPPSQPLSASQACRVSPLGSWSLAATLLADVNHPESQEDLVSNWEPARSLVADVSGAEIAPFLLALAAARLPPACLPASSRGWAGPHPLALLWYSLSPLFCERARPLGLRKALG